MVENLKDVLGQRGVKCWRRDTFEYFGTWDDCWARVDGAFLDDDGTEIYKSM